MNRLLNVCVIILIFLIVGILFTGCDMEKEITASSFNGVYEYNNIKLYVIAISKDELEYYFIDEDENDNYGTLYYLNEIAKNRDFDELIKLSLDEDNLVVETKNIDNLKSGTYKKIKDYSLDEYYKDTYGYDKYHKSKYNGKFINRNNIIYIYQPRENYVVFYSDVNNSTSYCEVKLNDKNELKCIIFDTKYIIKFNNDELYYIVQSDEIEDNFEGTFTKEKSLSKQEIIKIFEPFLDSDESIQIYEE
ncbi:MAG: hypothetical protein IJR82_03575 [Bacilli bacterium]|nr:hypothetical protein [Bacilli bacterium]